MALLTRRNLLVGLVAAPAIVRAISIMPVKLWKPETELERYLRLIRAYAGKVPVRMPRWEEQVGPDRRAEFLRIAGVAPTHPAYSDFVETLKEFPSGTLPSLLDVIKPGWDPGADSRNPSMELLIQAYGAGN